jgi:hypothetical protein
MGVVGFVLSLTASATSAQAANLFATVDISGNLISGSGATGSIQLGPGQYEVTFSSNVSDCAYVATTVNAYSQALQVFTAGGHLSANGVYVETKNQGGGLTDGPFHLAVVCGTTKMHFAVVDYAGNLARGTPGATISSPGLGRYNITFLVNVKNCAYLATVGDPGNGLVFAPSGVYTGSGPNTKTVYIETKNPGAGLQPGVPFHLAVICAAPKTSFAVADANGVPNRSSALTSSFRSATGRYVVVEGANIGNCATIATRGSVNKSVPFFPTTVELIPGPALNTIGIELRELLAFGGNPFSDAFHAATFCQ